MSEDIPLSSDPIHGESALKRVIIGAVQKLIIAEIYALMPALLGASWIVSPFLNFFLGKILDLLYVVSARFVVFSRIDILVEHEDAAYREAANLIRAAQNLEDPEEIRRLNAKFDAALRELIDLRRGRRVLKG